MELTGRCKALHKFFELLPTVKSDVDSVEAEIKALEIASTSGANLEQGADLEARVGALEQGIRDILESPTVCFQPLNRQC